MSIPSVLDSYPLPECARLLGFDMIEADARIGRVKIAFNAKREFSNAAGNVQGGFLTAMLDDCMGPAVLIHTEAAAYPTTINLNVSFLAPAKPGRMIGEATVVQLGRTIGFVEAELRDEGGSLVACATASVRIVPTAKAVG